MDEDVGRGKLRAVAGWRWRYAWRGGGGEAMSVGQCRRGSGLRGG